MREWQVLLIIHIQSSAVVSLMGSRRRQSVGEIKSCLWTNEYYLSGRTWYKRLRLRCNTDRCAAKNPLFGIVTIRFNWGVSDLGPRLYTSARRNVKLTGCSGDAVCLFVGNNRFQTVLDARSNCRFAWQFFENRLRMAATSVCVAKIRDFVHFTHDWFLSRVVFLVILFGLYSADSRFCRRAIWNPFRKFSDGLGVILVLSNSCLWTLLTEYRPAWIFGRSGTRDQLVCR